MRGVATFFLSLVAIVSLALTHTLAYAGWCSSDPIIGFKAPGMREADVNIVVSVPEEHQDQLHLVEILVVHPINVTPRVKYMDGLLPEQVVFAPSPIPWLFGKVPVQVVVSGIGLEGELLGIDAPLPFPLAVTITHTLANGQPEVREMTGMSIVPMVDAFGLYVRR
jgi:hypothetical protein